MSEPGKALRPFVRESIRSVARSHGSRQSHRRTPVPSPHSHPLSPTVSIGRDCGVLAQRRIFSSPRSKQRRDVRGSTRSHSPLLLNRTFLRTAPPGSAYPRSPKDPDERPANYVRRMRQPLRLQCVRASVLHGARTRFPAEAVQGLPASPPRVAGRWRRGRRWRTRGIPGPRTSAEREWLRKWRRVPGRERKRERLRRRRSPRWQRAAELGRRAGTPKRCAARPRRGPAAWSREQAAGPLRLAAPAPGERRRLRPRKLQRSLRCAPVVSCS
jgi:hypothetical protein